jgi:hypothetical protein
MRGVWGAARPPSGGVGAAPATITTCQGDDITCGGLGGGTPAQRGCGGGARHNHRRVSCKESLRYFASLCYNIASET